LLPKLGALTSTEGGVEGEKLQANLLPLALKRKNKIEGKNLLRAVKLEEIGHNC